MCYISCPAWVDTRFSSHAARTRYGDELVAIGHRELLTTIGIIYQCYCKDDCLCMSPKSERNKLVTITRDSAVDALPEPCPGGPGRKLKSRKAQK